MADIRVLHISTAHSWRGGEQQIAYTVAELQKLGVAQAVVAAAGGEMAKFGQQQNWEIITSGKKSSLDLTFAKAIARSAKEFNAHLLHVHDSHGHTFAVLAWLLYGCRTPIILHRRVDFPVGENWLSRYKYNFKGIARIICISRAIKEVIAPRILDKRKLRVIPSAIDPDKFTREPEQKLRSEYHIEDDKFLIGNVAALVGHKDYYTFLNTAKLLVEKELPVHFIIMGEGSLRADLEAYCKKLGLQSSVTFTGFRSDIAQVFPELDALLFSSEMEGLGTTVLDAYAAKVPVVATRAGGIPELVIENETALLADVKDHGTLAKNLEQLIYNDELRQRLIHNAHEHLQKFTKDQMAKNILGVYREVLSEK